MKIDDFYVENKKEINALSKVKLNISKELEKLLLSKPTNGHTEYYSIIGSPFQLQYFNVSSSLIKSSNVNNGVVNTL